MSLAVIDTNDVHLIGRLAEPPKYKTMPSGDAAVTFRLVVRRPPEAVRRQNTDSIACISYRVATVKAAAGWLAGEVFEVNGSVRRRFWRSEGVVRSAYDVEVRTARRVARAQAAKNGRQRAKAGAG